MSQAGQEVRGRAPAAAPVRRGGSRAAISGSTLTAYLFLTPYLLLFGVFVLLPAVVGLWISLHRYNYLLPNKPFVGLQNYADLFTRGSPTFDFFWQSMRATADFTITSVPLLMVVPLLVALLLNERFPGRTAFRALYFAPYVLGVAVVGIMWRYLLDPNVGLMHGLLSAAGITAIIPWTTALPWVWVSLVGVTVWWTLGFNAIIYLAGLQGIERGLYDAAKVDGAGRWQRFWNITLPGLRPVIFFVLTVTTLASANMFGQSYVMTRGAPGNETRTAIMYIANQGLQSYHMGAAAAMSYILALVLAAVSILYARFLGGRND
jgi:multiple sugar transport system permease protein